MFSSSTCMLASAVLLLCLTASGALAAPTLDSETLLPKMEEAWARVNDYRASVGVQTYTKENMFESERFVYSFKKPNWIRIDFESPHAGMVLVYPDGNGKVAVQPAGLAHLLKFHLAPDSRLLGGSSGQRIDQTDIGLLIRNISHSLTDQRRGIAEITEDRGLVKIKVLAADHFRENVTTLYQFHIDEAIWLPVKVEEFTPDGGRLKRSITFDNLKINNGFPDSLFTLSGG